MGTGGRLRNILIVGSAGRDYHNSKSTTSIIGTLNLGEILSEFGKTHNLDIAY